MAELRVANFNDGLMAKLKSEAALSGSTIKDFLERLVDEALRPRKRA
jgi:hypothetical protein